MNSTDTLAGTTPAVLGKRPLRTALSSVFAVLSGLVTTFVITTAVDMTLHAAGVFPPFGQRMSDALFVLALAYRIPFNAAGCYVAARLSPGNPARHAYALGVVGTVVAGIGAVAMCEYGPLWYSLANIAIALPCAFLGVRLFESVRATRAS
jgi:hypothetical protein